MGYPYFWDDLGLPLFLAISKLRLSHWTIDGVCQKNHALTMAHIWDVIISQLLARYIIRTSRTMGCTIAMTRARLYHLY